MAFTFWKPTDPLTGVYQSPVKGPMQVPTEAGPRPVLVPVSGGASTPTVEPPPAPAADNTPSSGCADCDIPVTPPALPAITLPSGVAGSPTQVIYPGGERAQPEQMPLTGEGGHKTVLPMPEKDGGGFPWWLLVVGAGAVYLFTR